MEFEFLEGGGELGALIRAHDWQSTPLGPAAAWPQSLRTAVRLLLNSGHPMYLFWGPEGVCLYNDAYRRSIGPERHPGSLGRPAREVWDEIWPIIGPQIEQVMSGRGATWNENHLVPITRHGVREDVYWTYSYMPIDDEHAPNAVGGVLVVCTETTLQVTLLKRLAQSEERLRLALAGARSIGTWDWDVQSDRFVADEGFAQLYGVDAERAALGAPMADFFRGIHPDDLPGVRAAIDRTMSTGVPFSEEYRLVQVGRPERWVVAEGQCERADDGTPLRFPGVSFEITSRKLMELRLKELNADLERKVVERTYERGRTWQVSPELLGVLNSDGIFETSNPAWATILGWTEVEVASQVFFDFIHPDDIEKTQIAWADAIERGIPALRFENRYRRKDGEYRWLSWVAVPEDGKIYCSARDITEAKQQAEALGRAEQSLRQSHKMEAVGQLTGGLAHDFNNLLAAISGSLEVIEKALVRGRKDLVDRYLETGKGAVKRAAALTHRLLAFSRQQTLDPKPTNLNRMIMELEDLIRRTVGPAIRVDVIAARTLSPTLVDSNQLENALLNLCINARDAMPEGGRLTIETSNRCIDERTGKALDLAPGEYVSLRVTDTGVGMTPDVQAKAFDPFFTTKPIGAGTGLGLSMVYGLARQLGGQLTIVSEVGVGTTMCIDLPRHDEDGRVDAPPAARGEPLPAGDGEAVLVIDDEPAVRQLIVEVLEEAGYAAIAASDGHAALGILRSDARIDLLVTDVGLPGGLNGRQVAEEARLVRPALRVLFITGYAETSAFGFEQLEKGTALMTKPFSMDALARKVTAMLSDF